MSENEQSINISPKNVSGKCDTKCSYNFKYPETNLTAKNNEIMISLTCDNTSNPPVQYNFQNYNVSNIIIISPSIHIFNNEVTNAEILIEHEIVNGGSSFFVCLPIIQSSNTTTASSLLTEVINDVASNAPSDGESTTINISSFTLDSIVPKKPFFSYTGQDINNSSSDFIVFGKMDAIPLSSDTLSSLSQIIKPFPIKTPGTSLFFNSSGPNTSSGDNGIYISCNPTGSSDDETDVSYSKNTSNNNLGSLLNNPIVILIIQILLGCILFIGMFMLLNYVFTLAVDSPIKLPAMKIPGIK